MGLNWASFLLDLDGELQLDLLGNGASLLLGLRLDLSLDLSCHMRRQSRQQLDRLLETWNSNELMPDGGLDLDLRLCLDLRLTLRLELDLEFGLDLGRSLDLELLRDPGRL